MIDHTSLTVSDFAKSRGFFERALKPLGYKVIREFPGVAGLGEGERADFWIAQGKSQPVHLAFAANNRKLVDEFYKAATAAGGRDNGGPGLRTQYHPDYYAAFVYDPDGNNIEVVCRKHE